MTATETALSGVWILEPKVFEDHRGYFYESYNENAFQKATGQKYSFIQDNQSRSAYGVLRGLHYQLNPHAQAKLVRATEGKLLDVAVDIRKGSPTYGEHVAVVLSASNKRQILIPKGFAHGFVVLSDFATIQYKCDQFYSPKADGGIMYNDPDLDIDWQIPEGDIILSEKDQKHLKLADTKHNFTF